MASLQSLGRISTTRPSPPTTHRFLGELCGCEALCFSAQLRFFLCEVVRVHFRHIIEVFAEQVKAATPLVLVPRSHEVRGEAKHLRALEKLACCVSKVRQESKGALLVTGALRGSGGKRVSVSINGYTLRPSSAHLPARDTASDVPCSCIRDSRRDVL